MIDNNIENKKRNKYHLLGAVIIFFFAVLMTYLNLGLTKEIIGDDAGVGYHFSNMQFNLASSMWDSQTFPGRSNVAGSISLVHISIINTLNKIGLTPIVVDRLLYIIFFFVSGFGLYLLAYNICRRLDYKNGNLLWLASLSGALLYIFNNFTMVLLSFPPTNYLYSYMLLPWIFLLYYQNFHIDRSAVKRIIFALLFLFILFGNPSNTITIVVFLLIYEIFFRQDNKLIQNWKNFSLTLVLIILLSSYMVLPPLGNSENPYGQVLGNEASIAYNSLNTSIDNLLRFIGHPAKDTYIFNRFLLRNRSIVANYLLLLLSLGFLLKKRISKIEIFLFVTFLLFLFLAKATHSPFSSVNEWNYSTIPFFEMYRASYYKFIFYCVFSLSILLSISLVIINEKISQYRLSLFIKILIAIFPLLLVLISAMPFFQGKVARDIHKTTIPAEYHRANEYFSSLKADFSILSLPQLPSGLTLDWGNGNYYGSGANPDPYLLGRPVWTNGWFLSENSVSSEFSFYKNFLSRTNVKYVFLHKDIPESYYFKVGIKGRPKGQTNYNKLNDQITSNQDFKLIEDNKYFKIFEIKEGKYSRHFEIPNRSVISDQYIEDFFKAGSKENWPEDTAVYLLEQNMGREQVLDQMTATSSAVKPVLEYKKIGSTKYRIRIHGASEPFPLVFNESFQIGWKMYLNEIRGNDAKGTGPAVSGIVENNNLKNGHIYETWLKKPAKSSDNQLMVNAYANSWLIDPSADCNSGGKCRKNPDGTYDMELILEFWPQRLFYLGVGISGVTLLFCLGTLLFSLVDRRLKNDNK